MNCNDTEYKITKVTDEVIELTNLDDATKLLITHDHAPDCCENNYADFEQLDDLAMHYTFKGRLQFEEVPGAGFRFGDSRRMFFVPCYTIQNGYYSDDVDIYLNDVRVLNVEAEYQPDYM